MIPEGYIVGQDRSDPFGVRVSHIYKGNFDDPGDPMCKRGWNRGEDGYSIWRGCSGKAGICKVCQRRANTGLQPVPAPKCDNNIETAFDDTEIEE